MKIKSRPQASGEVVKDEMEALEALDRIIQKVVTKATLRDRELTSTVIETIRLDQEELIFSLISELDANKRK